MRAAASHATQRRHSADAFPPLAHGLLLSKPKSYLSELGLFLLPQ